MSKQTKAQQAERAEAIERLKQWIKPGDVVYTVLRHVSASGMSRVIDLKIVETVDNYGNGETLEEPRISHVGFTAAIAMNDSYDRKKEGIKVSGCGMDMGFHVVYNLSYTLYPEYRCPGAAKCQSPHQKRAATEGAEWIQIPYGPETMHKDGYALRQRWI